MKQNFIKWPAHPKILTSHTPPLFVTIDQDNMPGTLSPSSAGVIKPITIG